MNTTTCEICGAESPDAIRCCTDPTCTRAFDARYPKVYTDCEPKAYAPRKQYERDSTMTTLYRVTFTRHAFFITPLHTGSHTLNPPAHQRVDVICSTPNEHAWGLLWAHYPWAEDSITTTNDGTLSWSSWLMDYSSIAPIALQEEVRR